MSYRKALTHGFERHVEVQQFAAGANLFEPAEIQMGLRTVSCLKIEKAAGCLPWRDDLCRKGSSFDLPIAERIFLAPADTG